MQRLARIHNRTDKTHAGLSAMQIPTKEALAPTYNTLGLANTHGPHKASRRWTWYSPNGQHHNQIDYILLKQRFRSGINTAKTRNFAGANTGSDRDLVMTNVRLHLKKYRQTKPKRMKFDLWKLKDPKITEAFLAIIDMKFAPLTILEEKCRHRDIDQQVQQCSD